MGSSSEDDSEISESEISSYKEKIYEELKAGKYKIKISNDIYKCPFCLGKKKQQHDYKSIMQHSSGIGKGSSNRRAKQKAHHLALAKYIERYLPNESKSCLKDKNAPGPTNSIVKLEPLTKSPQESDQYVWPWTGIIVNLPRPRDDDDDYLKKYYSRFSPLRVHTLWNSRDRIGYAILDFSRDWAGFDNAIAFEKEFESKDHGKKHWKKWRSDPGSRKYGWFARADDYHSEGLIGQHLRQYGELRTFTDITEEATKKTQTLVEFLTEEIAAKNEDIYKWQSRCDETSRSVNMLMEEKDRLQRAHNEEIKRLQRTSRERTKNILFESELMQRDLDSRRRDLEHWSKELNKRESLNEFERRKHEEEKDKSQMKNNELEMASMEQKKADENILRLIESQKREKEAALNKILQLEKKLDAKQKLELEIEELKGNRQVMQHMGGEDDQKLQEQMKKIDEDLKDKMDEMEDLEAMNQTLLVKERVCNDELQEARKVLIEGLREILTTRTGIIIKRMGELDPKPFQKACKARFPGKEAMEKAAELCSLWQEHLRKPEWHPFKVVVEGDNPREIVKEDDEMLVGARNEFGDEVCEAIITSLKEMNEYNPSGRYIVPQLWNLKENRKATLKEVIAYILKSVKSLMPKKRKRCGI